MKKLCSNELQVKVSVQQNKINFSYVEKVVWIYQQNIGGERIRETTVPTLGELKGHERLLQKCCTLAESIKIKI